MLEQGEMTHSYHALLHRSKNIIHQIGIVRDLANNVPRALGGDLRLLIPRVSVLRVDRL